MNLHYVAATMLWISVCLFQQEAYSRDLPTNKKAAMIEKAPEKSEKKDFCDNIVDKLKDILLSSKSESTKIADIKALANESFDMPRIYAKATSQIKKKHSLDSRTEAELNTAI